MERVACCFTALSLPPPSKMSVTDRQTDVVNLYIRYSNLKVASHIVLGCFRACHIQPTQWPSWQHMAIMRDLERYVSGNPFTHSDGWLYTNVVPSKAIIMNSHILLNVMSIFIIFLGMPSSFFPNCPFHSTPLTSLSSLHFPHPSYIFFWTLLQCFHNVVSQHYFVMLPLCALFLDHLFTSFVSLFFHLHYSFL